MKSLGPPTPAWRARVLSAVQHRLPTFVCQGGGVGGASQIIDTSQTGSQSYRGRHPTDNRGAQSPLLSFCSMAGMHTPDIIQTPYHHDLDTAHITLLHLLGTRTDSP
jgi:hypothetical protein